MLLSNTTYWVLLIGAVLIGAGGVLVLSSAHGLRHENRSAWAVAVAAAALGVVAGVYLYWWPTEVVEVTGSGEQLRVEKFKLIGSHTVELPGGPVTLTGKDDHTWVINRSDRQLMVKSFVYSSSPFPNYDDPDLVPPNSATQVGADELQHIGPGDRPPASKSSSTGFEVVYWLTW